MKQDLRALDGGGFSLAASFWRKKLAKKWMKPLLQKTFFQADS